jgi:hypothetical protein
MYRFDVCGRPNESFLLLAPQTYGSFRKEGPGGTPRAAGLQKGFLTGIIALLWQAGEPAQYKSFFRKGCGSTRRGANMHLETESPRHTAMPVDA